MPPHGMEAEVTANSNGGISMLYKISAASALLIAASLGAQTVVVPQSSVQTAPNQNVAIVPSVAVGNVLRAGAPIPVVLSDYLTTKGQAPEADYRMIEEMGFVITRTEGIADA